jgi:hypothetical protein
MELGLQAHFFEVKKLIMPVLASINGLKWT